MTIPDIIHVWLQETIKCRLCVRDSGDIPSTQPAYKYTTFYYKNDMLFDVFYTESFMYIMTSYSSSRNVQFADPKFFEIVSEMLETDYLGHCLEHSQRDNPHQ